MQIVVAWAFMILLATVTNGGETFVSASKERAPEAQVRDCRSLAQADPAAPVIARNMYSDEASYREAFNRHQALVDSCMTKRGFKRVV